MLPRSAIARHIERLSCDRVSCIYIVLFASGATRHSAPSLRVACLSRAVTLARSLALNCHCSSHLAEPHIRVRDSARSTQSCCFPSTHPSNSFSILVYLSSRRSFIARSHRVIPHFPCSIRQSRLSFAVLVCSRLPTDVCMGVPSQTESGAVSHTRLYIWQA